MEVRFFLTREDLWHLLKYATLRRGSYRLRLFIFLPILIIAAIILLGFVFTSVPTSPENIAVNILPWIFLLILIPLLIIFGWRRTAARGAGRGGEYRISIHPEGVREQTELGNALRSWKAFKSIEHDNYNLYFVSDTMSSRIFISLPIPRRAFATPQDAEQFLNQARAYWMNREMPPVAAPTADSAQ